ncbi:hypothetical protein M422DRAFT_273184 [Sphaerobolus stellatus SS14]|uniref:Uncharacterized protein n=1 Tax=Sphaerobolus stellatus (strain SS14) TaxID=990650 RepID=A0A0C9U9P7_SPHS4|nr:hypothetical protein M422DRAFT_273184 [Sphaerobolus stellatus SS14]
MGISEQERVFFSSLKTQEVKAYREWAFPKVVGDRAHDPSFTLQNTQQWIQMAAFKLFQRVGRVTAPKDTSNSPVEDALLGDLEAYQQFLLPSGLRNHKFFDLENAEIWALVRPFDAFLREKRVEKRVDASSSDSDMVIIDDDSPPPTPKKIKEEPTPDEFAYGLGSGNKDDPFIFDFNSSSSPLRNPQIDTRKRKRGPSTPVTSEYDASVTDSDYAPLSSPPRKRIISELGHQPGIKITRKTTVSGIKVIKELPKIWTVPRDGSAYLVDITETAEDSQTLNGKARSMDGLIRAHDHDSWRGSSGRSEGDCVVYAGIFGDNSVRARKATLYCNGINTCECFEMALLAQTQRYEPDEEAKLALWEHEKEDRITESVDPSRCLVRFYNILMSTACRKPDCKGVPVMKQRADYETVQGHKCFIGCSLWKLSEQWEHRYVTIPEEVNEAELRLALETGYLSSNLSLGERCSFTEHPRFGNPKYCYFSHVENGKIIRPAIIQHKCPTKLQIFVPVDSKIRKALVIFQEPHNHPVHHYEKATPYQLELLHQLNEAAGPAPVTARQLTQASSTRQLLDGQTFDNVLPGFVDDRCLRDTLKKLNKEKYPNGMNWEGLQAECLKESALPLEKRYIHTVVVRGSVRIAVTMFYEIIKNIHLVPYAAIDFTFKPVKGDTNRWDVAAFLEDIGRRVILSAVTGEALKMDVFHNCGKLLALILDGEAAQVQALGDVLLEMNDPEINGVTTKDPLEVILYILKTCIEHLKRNIEEIDNDVPRVELDRLKGFIGLETEADIQEWRHKCETSPWKAVRDWYAHKVVHPWFLPSLNPTLSKMPRTHWNVTPNHSNLMETAHAGRNIETGIGANPLSAILRCRAINASIVIQIRQAQKTGNLRNTNNTIFHREKRAMQRRTHLYISGSKRQSEIGRLKELRDEHEDLKAKKKASMDRQHEIDNRLLDLTQLPRHLGSPAVTQEISALTSERERGKEERREWEARNREVKAEMKPLQEQHRNAKLNGRRPLVDPSQSKNTISASDTENIAPLGTQQTDYGYGYGYGYGYESTHDTNDYYGSLNTAMQSYKHSPASTVHTVPTDGMNAAVRAPVASGMASNNADNFLQYELSANSSRHMPNDSIGPPATLPAPASIQCPHPVHSISQPTASPPIYHHTSLHTIHATAGRYTSYTASGSIVPPPNPPLSQYPPLNPPLPQYPMYTHPSNSSIPSPTSVSQLNANNDWMRWQ